MGSRRLLVGRAAALPLVMVLITTACGAPSPGAEASPPTTPITGATTQSLPPPAIAADVPATDVVEPPTPPPPYPDVCATPLPDGMPIPVDDWSPAPSATAGLTHVATAGGGQFVVHTTGGDRTFLNGVNLGAALPGAGPDGWMAGRRTYTIWLEQIAALGFRSIRTYTLHPAAFYDALTNYNVNHPREPIYLIQGVWFPQDQIGEFPMTVDADLTAAFDADIANTVAAVAGHLPDHPDPRFGSFTTDVTPWLAGMILGVEWDPAAVAGADLAAPVTGATAGEYVVAAPGASPTERWLADRLEAAATHLAEMSVSAPLAFVNWAPTDPLAHPTEADPALDRVSLDPNHLAATDAWPGGLFAAYHAYPYFPDFLETEPGIADFSVDGTIDPYAGYLAKLRDHHGDMPVVIAETGVPSGWLEAGSGPDGRHYGGLFEATQMRINAEMLDTARRLGLGGSMLFEWVDEWFKPTWNLADLEVGNGSAWHNLLSPEQHFGIVAIEPVPAARLDGAVSDWSDEHRIDTEGELEIFAAHDAAGISVMVQGQLPDTFEIRFDTDSGLFHRTDQTDPRSDVSIRISPVTAEMYERTGYTPRLAPIDGGESPSAIAIGETGTWEPFAALTGFAVGDRAAAVATLDALRRSAADGTGTVPAEEAGWARTRNVVEVRVPWTVLGFADPASGVLLRFRSTATFATQTSVGVGVLIGDDMQSGTYTWTPWDTPRFRQRLKHGRGALAAALCRTSYFYR